VQSFTACMLLLTATSAFRLGEDAGVLLSSVIYTVSVPPTVLCKRRPVIQKLKTEDGSDAMYL